MMWKHGGALGSVWLSKPPNPSQTGIRHVLELTFNVVVRAHHTARPAGAANKKQKDVELGAPNPKESPRETPQGSPQGVSHNPPSTQAVPGADGEYVGLPGGPARPEKRTMLGMLGGLMRPISRGEAPSWMRSWGCA